MLSIIVAVDLNNAIGRKNALLWHISRDLKYLKSVTTSHPVIMGRNTYYSIGRPLPGRRNIVVSGKGLPDEQIQKALSAIKPDSNTSFELCADLDSLVKRAKESGEEYFVMGGGQLYNALFSHADRLYITRIHASAAEADTFFPAIDGRQWQVISDSGKIHDEENGIDFSFIIYRRVR